jgi:amino-acid N-acetyltransferase
MADIPAMHDLIQNYAKEGIMLRRPIMMLYESVRDFLIAVDEETGKVVGCGGLHILWSDLAEIRSLVVHPDYKGHGVGKGIVDYLVNEGDKIGLSRIFALTYQQVFFEKCGFHVVQKETLPQKVWKECVYCDKFHNCDEIAVIRFLTPQAELPEETFEIPLFEIPNWQKG